MGKHMRILRRLFLGASVLLAVTSGGLAVAQNVTQGYQSDERLQKGMIVRLKPADGTKVQAVTQQDETEMLGVVVTAGDAAVSLSNTAAEQEVFVANFGRYDVLVSTQQGTIKTGDYITISSLAGVGMKVDNNREFVLGKALKDFDGRSASEGSSVLKTSTGDKTVSLGRIPIEISIAHNPHFRKDSVAGVPEFLTKVVGIVTDQPVAAFRIYASTLIVIITLIITGVILFAGVRSGMIAIGRNPLAKKTIARNLVQVTLMALIVFVIGAIAVYLLLRV